MRGRIYLSLHHSGSFLSGPFSLNRFHCGLGGPLDIEEKQSYRSPWGTPGTPRAEAEEWREHPLGTGPRPQPCHECCVALTKFCPSLCSSSFTQQGNAGQQGHFSSRWRRANGSWGSWPIPNTGWVPLASVSQSNAHMHVQPWEVGASILNVQTERTQEELRDSPKVTPLGSSRIVKRPQTRCFKAPLPCGKR